MCASVCLLREKRKYGDTSWESYDRDVDGASRTLFIFILLSYYLDQGGFVKISGTFNFSLYSICSQDIDHPTEKFQRL